VTDENFIKTLKGSQLGYHGKGAPDIDTIMRLQEEYCEAILARGNLPPEVPIKLKRMRELHAEVERGKAGSMKARLAAQELAVELAPILHFKVDDVDWDN
jgi:hypothetical protein